MSSFSGCARGSTPGPTFQLSEPRPGTADSCGEIALAHPGAHGIALIPDVVPQSQSVNGHRPDIIRHWPKFVYSRLTATVYTARFLTMQLRHEPHRLLINLPPELHQRLQAEVSRQTTLAHRATMAGVIRSLIAEHCAPEPVREVTA